MNKIPTQEIYTLLAAMPGSAGLYIEDVDGGEVFEIDPGRVFPSASVIKIPILALLLRDAREGRLDLHAPHPIAPGNRVGGTGILYELGEDYAPSLYHMGKLMIVLSDNTATNEIIDAVGGFERVSEFCRELGYGQTLLARKMMDYDAIKQGRNNYMSAGETGRMLSAIARGELLSAEISATILEFMGAQQCRNKLPSLLPSVPCYAPPKDKKELKAGTVLVANKTGDLYGIQHDVGVFTLPGGRRFIIAAFTGDLEDDNDGIFTIAKIALAVYNALK